MKSKSSIKQEPVQQQAEQFALKLREIIITEVRVYLSKRPKFLPYFDDLVGQIYLSLAKSLEKDAAKALLKTAAKNQLMRCIRDISCQNRTSPIAFLNTIQPMQLDDEGNEIDLVDLEEDRHDEARSAADILSTKEAFAAFDRLYYASSEVGRRVIRDRLSGFTLREIAARQQLGKTAVHALLSDFANEFRTIAL